MESTKDFLKDVKVMTQKDYHNMTINKLNKVWLNVLHYSGLVDCPIAATAIQKRVQEKFQELMNDIET